MSDFTELKALAADLRDEFNKMASQLDKHVTNINISRVVGGVAGVAGGVTAIVGFALIPVTFGISAVVCAAVGSAIAGAGGATAGGASITKLVMEKMKLNRVEAKWKDFCMHLQEKLERQNPKFHEMLLNKNPDLMALGRDVIESTAATAGRTGSVTLAGVEAARAVMATGPRAAARLAAISARGSIILNSVLVFVSLYDIIDGSIELRKGKGSKVGDYCRKLAQSLDELARDGLTEEYLMRAMEM